jgi:hypothetical protein
MGIENEERGLTNESRGLTNESRGQNRSALPKKNQQAPLTPTPHDSFEQGRELPSRRGFVSPPTPPPPTYNMLFAATMRMPINFLVGRMAEIIIVLEYARKAGRVPMFNRWITTVFFALIGDLIPAIEKVPINIRPDIVDIGPTPWWLYEIKSLFSYQTKTGDIRARNDDYLDMTSHGVTLGPVQNPAASGTYALLESGVTMSWRCIEPGIIVYEFNVDVRSYRNLVIEVLVMVTAMAVSAGLIGQAVKFLKYVPALARNPALAASILAFFERFQQSPATR